MPLLKSHPDFWKYNMVDMFQLGVGHDIKRFKDTFQFLNTQKHRVLLFVKRHFGIEVYLWEKRNAIKLFCNYSICPVCRTMRLEDLNCMNLYYSF
jgi:phage-related protein